MNDNSRQVWSHDSTAWGLIQRRLQRERAEAERIEAEKSEIDRFHEEALQRFYSRAGEAANITPAVSSEAQEKVNLAQRVNEANRAYWVIRDGKFESITK